jgi:sugar/nucleoside kinase (ribokinase family)
MYDVLCYGALCADTLIRVPRFPAPGEGVRALSEATVPGGNAMNEARCLARWGERVALMGDHLGDDPEGALLTEASMGDPGLDASFIQHSPGWPTPRCRIIVTPDGQRTVVAVRGEQHPFTPPTRQLLERCRVVSVSFFGAGTLTAAHAAREAGCLLVAGDALLPGDQRAPLADVIVGSAATLRAALPGADLREQMRRLQGPRGAAIIVSDAGSPACALVGDEWLEVAPPAIVPLDSNGAGDCFRAAIARGLARGWEWPRTLAWAVAAGAAWCLKMNNEPPSLAEVERLVR